MKRPTPASLKKVTPENLARLGPERLAEILAGVADTRPELKRRLRMELAAEQGPEHLVVEIDRRLGSIGASKSRVSWRQRSAFVRDLESLRTLIADRLSAQEPAAALERLFTFLGLVGAVRGRVRDKEGEVAAVFARAANDLGRLISAGEVGRTAELLAGGVAAHPADWPAWLPVVFADGGREVAGLALRSLSGRTDALASWLKSLRALADAAGDVDAFRATFTAKDLQSAAVATEVALRLLATERTDEARQVLETAKPVRSRWRSGTPDPDFEWEGAWIEVLERSGDTAGAQAARWASFARTLSVERARAFTSRLTGFDDVEAEERAFALAREHADFEAGLRFLMTWPSLPEASRMILARSDEAEVAPEAAELWAARLRVRFPQAANLLLRRAAAGAFRRREFTTSQRLTQEADSIGV